VKEISLILKNNLLVTIEEFRILDSYSHPGKIWTLIHRPTPIEPYLAINRTVEYIFDPEALTIFGIISTNILATWDTEATAHLGTGIEFWLKDSLFLRPYLDVTTEVVYNKI
jgi:hypothetical protein